MILRRCLASRWPTAGVVWRRIRCFFKRLTIAYDQADAWLWFYRDRYSPMTATAGFASGSLPALFVVPLSRFRRVSFARLAAPLRVLQSWCLRSCRPDSRTSPSGSWRTLAMTPHESVFGPRSLTIYLRCGLPGSKVNSARFLPTPAPGCPRNAVAVHDSRVCPGAHTRRDCAAGPTSVVQASAGGIVC